MGQTLNVTYLAVVSNFDLDDVLGRSVRIFLGGKFCQRGLQLVVTNERVGKSCESLLDITRDSGDRFSDITPHELNSLRHNRLTQSLGAWQKGVIERFQRVLVVIVTVRDHETVIASVVGRVTLGAVTLKWIVELGVRLSISRPLFTVGCVTLGCITAIATIGLVVSVTLTIPIVVELVRLKRNLKRFGLPAIRSAERTNASKAWIGMNTSFEFLGNEKPFHPAALNEDLDGSASLTAADTLDREL
jgi:hypothetical protein